MTAGGSLPTLAVSRPGGETRTHQFPARWCEGAGSRAIPVVGGSSGTIPVRYAGRVCSRHCTRWGARAASERYLNLVDPST